jgi:hypothetical protein
VAGEPLSRMLEGKHMQRGMFEGVIAAGFEN